MVAIYVLCYTGGCGTAVKAAGKSSGGETRLMGIETLGGVCPGVESEGVRVRA